MRGSTPDERAQRHKRLMDRVRLSAEEGNREHQLLLFVWKRRLNSAAGFQDKTWRLHAFEWDVEEGQSQWGKGDAVFVDSSGGCALVLELKALHEVRQGASSAVNHA